MDVDVADPERSGAAAEIDVPHADELVAALGFDFVMDSLEVVVPAHERLVVMAVLAPGEKRH